MAETMRYPRDLAPDAIVPRQVVIVGEALVDVVHRVDGSTDEVPGGSPANGRLGRKPQLVTSLGDDERGARVRQWLETSEVDVSATPLDRTSTATARLDETGTATYEFDIVWSVDTSLARAADLIHTG